MIKNLQYKQLESEDGIYYLEYQDNYFRINNYTHDLLNRIKDGCEICEISKDMNVLESEIEEFLKKIYEILTNKKSQKKIKRISILLNSSICDRVGKLLSFLFLNNRMMFLAIITVFTNIFFYLKYSHIQFVFSDITIIHYLFCLMFIMFIHELGHICAAYSFGLFGLNVKLGVFIIWPILYVDLNKQVLLQPKKRIKISLGGVYFQSILSIIMIIVNILVNEDILILLLNINNSVILLNLLPVFILDGYWVYSDLIGVDNLNTKSADLIKKSLINFREIVDAPLKLSIYAIVRSIFICTIVVYVLKLIYYRIGFTMDMFYLLLEGINLSLIIRLIWWMLPFILLIIYLKKRIIWRIFKK